jgi:hypothetical protein
VHGSEAKARLQDQEELLALKSQKLLALLEDEDAVAVRIERGFQSLQKPREVLLGKHLRAVGWSVKGITVLYEVAYGAKSYATAYLSVAVDDHCFQGAVALLWSLM